MSEKRASWSGQLAFIFAVAASAIGLGNLWRFPYLAARYGGGMFIVIYLALALTLGLVIMATEIAIGRRSKQSQLTAFSTLGHSSWAWVGALSTLIPMLMFPYYCVVVGWVIKFFAYYASVVSGFGAHAPDSGVIFDGFVASGGGPTFFMALAVIVTVVIVILGVKNGIERANKFLIPTLFLMAFALAIYIAFLPGAGAGIRYYLVPDFSKTEGLGKVVIGAMGQMFHSLSLAMGIMITYGSYLKREASVTRSAVQIVVADSLFAVLAGFMVIPVLYAIAVRAGQDPAAAMQSGPGLLFKSLPAIFDGMGRAGDFLGFVFFALAFFAAITSAISLCETCVASLCDRLGWRRATATMVFGAYAIAAGVLPAFSMTALDWIDTIINNMLLPICAIGICIFAGWVFGPGRLTMEIRDHGRRWSLTRIYAFSIRYIAPVLVTLILASNIAQTFGWLKL